MIGLICAIANLVGRFGSSIKDNNTDYTNKSEARASGKNYYYDHNFVARDVETDKEVDFRFKLPNGHVVTGTKDHSKIYQDFTQESKEEEDKKLKELENKIFNDNVENYNIALNNNKYYFNCRYLKVEGDNIDRLGRFKYNIKTWSLKRRVSDGLELFVATPDWYDPYYYLSSKMYSDVNGLIVYASFEDEYRNINNIVAHNYSVIEKKSVQNGMQMTRDELYEYAKSIGAYLTYREY